MKKDLTFYMALFIGVGAMFAGFAAQQWYVLMLGALLTLQTISEGRVKRAYFHEKELRRSLEAELEGISEEAPNTTVRMFWTRIKYQRDQQKPGGPLGPRAGVG